jgi:surface carbohydrate biosynthesis protein
MKLNRKWIYLPVEVKSRELVSKLFFADLATRSGYGVFLGRNGLNISKDRFPRGLYFDKCLSPHKQEFHRFQVRNLENILVSLDEEALIVYPGYAGTRFTQLSIDLASMIFAWGKKEASMIDEKYDTGEKVRVLGSPRIDCWRAEFEHLYDPEIKNIKRRFGDFILVNSNFGAGGLPENRYSEEDKRYLEQMTPIRGEFLKLMGKIAEAFPSRNVVLRPHPGEDQGLWASLKSELPKNVHIILEGSVSPWIRASSLLLHHCCTTAVEAWIAKKPIISYEPFLPSYPDYKPYHDLPSALSLRLTTQEEVLAVVQGGFSDDALFRSTQQAAAKTYFDFHEHELSSLKILSEFNKLPIEEDAYQIPSFTTWKKFRSFVGRTKYRIRDIWDEDPIPFRYQLQKNSGMQLEEIIMLTDRLELAHDQRQSQIHVHQVDVDTFCLFRE